MGGKEYGRKDVKYHTMLSKRFFDLFVTIDACQLGRMRRRQCATDQFQKCPKSSRRLTRHMSVRARVPGWGESVHAMAPTAHGLLVSNIRCKTRPMRASCTMQRTAEVTSDRPTPRWRVVDTKALKRIKARLSPTLAQVRLVDCAGVVSMVKLQDYKCFRR